jgi:hypothetical protein
MIDFDSDELMTDKGLDGTLIYLSGLGSPIDTSEASSSVIQFSSSLIGPAESKLF